MLTASPLLAKRYKVDFAHCSSFINLRPYLGNIFLLRLTVFFFILYGYEFINRLRQLRQISYIFNQKKIENIFWRQFLHTPYSIRMYTTVQDWVQLYGNSSEQYTALFRILQVIIFAFFRVCHFFSIKFFFFTFYVYCWLKDIIIFLILPIVFFKLWRLREGTR